MQVYQTIIIECVISSFNLEIRRCASYRTIYGTVIKRNVLTRIHIYLIVQGTISKPDVAVPGGYSDIHIHIRQGSARIIANVNIRGSGIRLQCPTGHSEGSPHQVYITNNIGISYVNTSAGTK